MADIIMHPACGSTSRARSQRGARSSDRRTVVILAGLALVAALSWGAIDAVAWTNSSLMRIYSVAVSTAA